MMVILIAIERLARGFQGDATSLDSVVSTTNGSITIESRLKLVSISLFLISIQNEDEIVNLSEVSSRLSRSSKELDWSIQLECSCDGFPAAIDALEMLA